MGMAPLGPGPNWARAQIGPGPKLGPGPNGPGTACKKVKALTVVVTLVVPLNYVTQRNTNQEFLPLEPQFN